MKLSEITLPITNEWGKDHALVFSVELAQRLADLHSEYGSPNCVPVPLVLKDGRLMLCADILTEIMPGALLYSMWQAADKNVLLSNVDILSWNDAINMVVINIQE